MLINKIFIFLFPENFAMLTPPNKICWLVLLTVFYFVSCKKDFIETNYQTVTNEVRFPVTDQEKELTSLTKEIGDVLNVIYQHPDVLQEVDAAIYSGFESDESITVKNLLQPESSSLYQFAEFTKRHITPGVFYKYFNEEVFNGNYPLIKKYYGSYLNTANAIKPNGTASFTGGSTSTSSAAPDTSLLKYEIWVVNGVKIYFPYSENFSATYDPGSPTINNTGNPGGPVVTTVSADRDANSGPGQEPYWVTDQYGIKHLTSRQVTVDDAYAETKATHIVNVMDEGVGNDPAPPPVPPPTTGPVYTVYVSWVRCNNYQYDHLISFTKNGGGSEIWFGEGYASRDASTGQVNPNFPANGVHLSRKDIRKNRWVHPFRIWTTNWKTEQTNNALGVWEEDTQGSKTLTGSLSGAFKVGTATLTATVGYSKTVVTQDPILRNTNMDRNYFFRSAAQNVENRGFQDGWPIRNAYNCVDFTMPYQIF